LLQFKYFVVKVRTNNSRISIFSAGPTIGKKQPSSWRQRLEQIPYPLLLKTGLLRRQANKEPSIDRFYAHRRAVGALTQYVFRSDDAVRYSLAIVTSVACALAAVLLYAALNPFVASLERVRVWNAAHSG
jgi:hypothetical protein